MFPILNPPPSILPIPSLWVIPVHQIQYRASNLGWRLISYMILYKFQCHSPKSPPPSVSPTESKRLFYTSVSLLLSCIQGYCYYLSKFHIYALVYGEGNGTPLQYSCLENPMDGGACRLQSMGSQRVRHD